ncbi:hypothetical protein D6833_13325 [Candidatus Parcubacteria bacterium]|nr:MAG: hypothetical protein D6833_13325 [Candidatus Parcubacteria bacterium]
MTTTNSNGSGRKRIDYIRRWLDIYGHEVEVGNVQIIFNCSGNKVVVEVKRRYVEPLDKPKKNA